MLIYYEYLQLKDVFLSICLTFHKVLSKLCMFNFTQLSDYYQYGTHIRKISSEKHSKNNSKLIENVFDSQDIVKIYFSFYLFFSSKLDQNIQLLSQEMRLSIFAKTTIFGLS